MPLLGQLSAHKWPPLTLPALAHRWPSADQQQQVRGSDQSGSALPLAASMTVCHAGLGGGGAVARRAEQPPSRTSSARRRAQKTLSRTRQRLPRVGRCAGNAAAPRPLVQSAGGAAAGGANPEPPELPPAAIAMRSLEGERHKRTKGGTLEQLIARSRWNHEPIQTPMQFLVDALGDVLLTLARGVPHSIRDVVLKARQRAPEHRASGIRWVLACFFLASDLNSGKRAGLAGSRAEEDGAGVCVLHREAQSEEPGAAGSSPGLFLLVSA